MNTGIGKLLGYASTILFIPAVVAAQPATADDYTIRTYTVPMSSTVERTYTVESAPLSMPVSTTTTYSSSYATPRIVTSPVVVERRVQSPVVIQRTVEKPVVIERSAPVMIDRTSPMIIERTSPVVIERPVKVKVKRGDSHHLLNFGVTPLVKLKVL